jgi:hypothetical protein
MRNEATVEKVTDDTSSTSTELKTAFEMRLSDKDYYKLQLPASFLVIAVV